MLLTRRKETWLAVILLAVGVPIVALVGLFGFMSAFTTPLYTVPEDVPSVTRGTPLPRWAEAVEEGRRIARKGLVDQNLPGLSVAVGVDGDILWAEGFGWSDIGTHAPVSPETRFRIGHASKALTSAAVGRLVEQDRLRPDADIQTYVPSFPTKPWPISVRQLMGHVAGIRHYEREEDYMPSAHCERASEGVRGFADDPLEFEPETRYGYSTFGWILVSAAVEAAAGEPFFAFMRSEIFEPLGMADTTSDSPAEPMPNLATFYYPRFSGDNQYGPELATAVDYSCFAGAGGFVSTPSDLVRFGMAFRGGTFLQPATARMLQSPQVLLSGEETAYGLGWMLDTIPIAGEPTRIASHASRTLLGGSTTFLTLPSGIVVAITSNTSYANTRHLALDIAAAFRTAARLKDARQTRHGTPR